MVGSQEKHLETYFASPNAVNVLNHKRTLYLAEYILFPIRLSDSNQTEVVLDVLGYRQRSKINLISKYNKKVFFGPCTPTIRDCWVGYSKLRWLLVKKRVQVVEIRSVWNDVNAKKRNSFFSTSSVHRSSKKSCGFIGKQLNYDVVWTSNAIQASILTKIDASINYNSWSCRNVLKDLYRLKPLVNIDVNQAHIPRYFSFGPEFHGFRCSLFISRRSSNEAFVDFNAFMLLLPFG